MIKWIMSPKEWAKMDLFKIKSRLDDYEVNGALYFSYVQVRLIKARNLKYITFEEYKRLNEMIQAHNMEDIALVAELTNGIITKNYKDDNKNIFQSCK